MKNFLVGLILIGFISCKAKNTATTTKTKWWKEAVVYQLYPRSFQDSDGDGVGDRKGITQRLDYLKELGINAVWLHPICASPNEDNGYDISYYKAIMKEMGKTAIPNGFSLGDELINNLHPLKQEAGNIVLQPYQANVVKLK